MAAKFQAGAVAASAVLTCEVTDNIIHTYLKHCDLIRNIIPAQFWQTFEVTMLRRCGPPSLASEGVYDTHNFGDRIPPEFDAAPKSVVSHTSFADLVCSRGRRHRERRIRFGL